MPVPRNNARIARFGVFELDLSAGELRKSGVKLRLQEQPFQVLALLLERAGEVVTREELQQNLWAADTFVDFDHSLNTAINKVREALGDSASSPRYVETVARRGYRFIAPVQSPAQSDVSGICACERHGGAHTGIICIHFKHPCGFARSPRTSSSYSSASIHSRALRIDSTDVPDFLFDGSCFACIRCRQWRICFSIVRAATFSHGNGDGNCRSRHSVTILSDFGGGIRLSPLGGDLPENLSLRFSAGPIVGGGSISLDPRDWTGRGFRRMCGALICSILGANLDSHGICLAAIAPETIAEEVSGYF